MTRSLSGRAVLLWLLAFFIPVIAVNVYFIIISVTTFRGEDEQKPYLQGVEYNTTIERRVEQEALGWKSTIAAQRLPSGAVQIAVSIRQASGAPESQVRLTGELRHPADETRDRPLTLVPLGDGQYRAEVPSVSKGAWDVIVNSDSAPFEAMRRVWIP